mgnify:CR=1 FL=1
MKEKKLKSLIAYKAGYKMAQVNEKLLKKLQVDNLKLSLCQGNNVDEDDNKIDCKTALKPRCYNTRKCDTCRRIDERFSDLLTFASQKEHNARLKKERVLDKK